MVLDKVRLLVAALWAGSLWAVGYLVAPTLFATLDRVLAGQIAGSMFHSMAMLSLGCGAAMGVLLFFGTGDWTPKRRRSVLLIVVAMVMCTVLSHFGLQPLMAAAKAANDGSFGKLHGLSSSIYLLQSLLAGWLVWKQA
ncbi:DUF4149 domain-containing protein [Massilia sp. SR12]